MRRRSPWQVAARSPVLTVACTPCERRGGYRTARLLEQHGPGFTVAALRALVSAECPSAAT